jgi:hypothetical protein
VQSFYLIAIPGFLAVASDLLPQYREAVSQL